MSAVDRSILSLSFVEQLPGATVADLLGLHAGNVSRRRTQSIKRLRNGLASLVEDFSLQNLSADDTDSLAQLLMSIVSTRDDC